MSEFKIPVLKPYNFTSEDIKLHQEYNDVLNKIQEQFAEQMAIDREHLAETLIAQGINPHAVTIATKIWYDDIKGTLNFKHVVISKTPENPL